jgi:MSHA biogenesis protein MshO
MPRSERTGPWHGQRGFTLIEAVMVIVLTGIVLAVLGRFIVTPVQAYLTVSARAALVDTADGALRRMGRELHAALPNSVRVTANGLSLELIPSTGAARYSLGGSDPLLFGSVDTSFALVGPPLTLAASQQLVFYNLGSGVTGSDAYAANGTATEQASSNRRLATNAAGSASTISLSSLAGLPVGDQAAPYRVTAVSAPVSYRCDLSAATLTRYTGYGFLATQPDPPVSGSSAVLASGVTACSFAADAAVVAARAGLVRLQLSLATNTMTGSETVSLQHAIHVDNLP